MTTSHHVIHKPNKEELGGEVNHRPLIFILLAAIVFWFLPHPAGIADNAWHLFVIFISTILGIMFRPMPVSSVVFIGMTASLVTRTLGYEEVLGIWQR